MAESTVSTNDARTMAGAQRPEATHPGVVVAPPVDIYETEKAILLLADMPGVAPQDLEVDLDQGVLTITGRVSAGPGEHEQPVLQEYRPATFQRKFTLSQSVDQAKIEARLEDGVLHLELPKVGKAQPRKIQVKG